MIVRQEKENGPVSNETGGAIPVSASSLVAMLDHDRPVMVVPVMMPAAIPVMMAVALDHDGFGAGNRRRRNRDRTDGSNDISKLLHVVLLLRSED